MKLLVTGSRGQLGRDCVSLMASQYEVMGLDLPEFDITSESHVRSTVSRFRPDIILNCAGFTRVDDCEKERDAAVKANVLGPGLLSRAAHETGALLVHLSTDYVFDGTHPVPSPYIETDQPNPVSWYGRTKLDGENAVAENTDRFIILRTAWLYGRHGMNFPKKILRLALANPGKTLRVVNDHYGSPTWSNRLAGQIREAIARNCRGVYHATAEGHCTWYDFARKFLDLMKVDHALVPCSASEYPTPARRPANSILENSRLKNECANVMREWDADLAEFVATFREELLREAEPRTQH